MTEDKLEFQGQRTAISQAVECRRHSRDAFRGRERAVSMQQAVTGAHCGQFPEQRAGVLIGNGKAIDVENGIAEPGVNSSITNIVHVGEQIHVYAGVNRGPCAANLAQAVGAQSGEQEQTVFSQYARDLGKSLCRIAHPRQQQIGKYNVETLVGKWKCRSICLYG